MASVKESQQDTMATIDAAQVMVDKVLAIMGLVSASPSLTTNFATNPIGFLLQLLEHLGVTYEELRDWLTNYIIYVLPLLEVSIKAVLLTNLKSMLSCTDDPRIPEKYRKIHKLNTESVYNSAQLNGIDISLESIDFYNKLSINPLSDEGKEWYFGLDGVKDVYKFARAEDFDAFLWFVMHKGKFPNSSKLNKISDLTNFIDGGGNKKVEPTDGTLLETLKVSSSEGSSRILPGNTFRYSGTSRVISLCIDSTYDKNNKISKNTLVPVSDDWNSVNWYVTRGDYYTNNLGIVNQRIRRYNDESAICNIQFLDQSITQDSPLTGLVNNKFRFSILQRPYVHVPNLAAGEPPWRFIKLLFNAKGEYDPRGKYTIPLSVGESYNASSKKIVITGISADVQIDVKSGNVTVGNKLALLSNLRECYPGLTVYEFNYDYVMGMRLFDAKTITTTLLDSLVNMRLGLGVNVSLGNQEKVDKLNDIIKNVIESDDISISDCFFEFSNDKYEALLKNAEERKAKKKDFKKVKDILNEYSDSTTLNKQVDVLNRAFTEASERVTDGVDAEEDKLKVRFDFVTDLIEQLTIAVVKCVLSPKVLMLFEVNETIMGGKWQKITFEDLLKSMRRIIVSVIKEIRDLIIQELLKLVMKALSPIVATLTSAIVREQIEAYTDIINDIIRNCPHIWFSFGSQDSETKLDTIDYADIDTSVTKEGLAPQLNIC